MTTTAPGGEGRNNERRLADRRRTDRREPRARVAEESWFDAAGVGPDSALGRDTEAGASAFDPAWGGADGAADSRRMSREARRVATSQDGALVRIGRTYAAARAVIGMALVAAQGVVSVLGSRAVPWVAAVCVLYAVQAVLLWLLPRFRDLTEPQVASRRRRRQWLATIGVDLLAFSALHVLESGASFNFAALLVLPVLMAGVLTSRMGALATSAGVALLLLLVAWRSSLAGGEGAAVLAQAGLAGIGLFVIALLAGELASRLAREEIAARGSLEIARQQAQLNRLVIEEMADGVLVIDRRLRVRAANPAARTLLTSQGLAPAAPFQLQARAVWAPLGAAVERALADADWPEGGRDVQLQFGDGLSRTLRVRVRFTRRGASGAGKPSGEDFCVLLLEDVRTAQARLRQEKLAAMGRVSAGIAHEIRNPLAAISQANALLLEGELSGAQAQLSRMVSDNVRRLQRIVDDVLEAAPGVAIEPSIFDARAQAQETVAEWTRTAGVVLGPDSRVRVELPAAALGVVFDPDHLRRVLVNLLDNALRHSTDRPGAVALRLAARDETSAVLSVASDGAPIGPDVEPHLFEPFFSTRSRGSGLGLYICRELCERYGASIEYRQRAATERHRNGFVVVMQRGTLALPVNPSQL
jgi:two-component system sensor histidine kinase PilS (NtrC family)